VTRWLHLGAVDGDQLDPHQAGVGARPQHIGEQIGQRPLVADSEARDRRVIRHPIGGDHAKRDVHSASRRWPWASGHRS
jgi:hypothetical protein